jgi:hypothetical protein
MIKTKINNLELLKILDNTVSYSNGFIEGIELNRTEFNKVLGGYTSEALGMYIDSKARMNPSMLHHVYEWNEVGNKNSRLFSINVDATKYSITFNGNFTSSKKPSSESGQIFVDKARVMENGISVTVKPKNSSVLAFEDDGETVFTSSSIYIAHPGGDQVAGSFGKVVEEFFDSYFNYSILRPLITKLKNPKEFSALYPQGTKAGKSVGVRAGRKYFSMSGDKLI